MNQEPDSFVKVSYFISSLDIHDCIVNQVASLELGGCLCGGKTKVEACAVLENYIDLDENLLSLILLYQVKCTESFTLNGFYKVQR